MNVVRADLRLLGGFGARVDGTTVSARAWERRSASDLVKLLALAPGRRMRREQVVDALWPDLLVEEAAPRLHKAAHYARRALGAPDAVVLAGDAVALLPDVDVQVDASAFEAAAELARADGGEESAASAADLYGGDLLPDDLYAQWAEDVRERLRLRHLELLHQAGRWDALAAADPVDEQANVRLAERLAERGDVQAALRQLDRLTEVLRRELDVEPGEGVQQLRARLLELGPDVATRLPRPARRTPVPVPMTATVGRERDVKETLRLLAGARVVTLLGPGGVGKTRLALEVARRQAEQDDAIDACFVDLTQIDAPELVLELLARELGVHGAPSTPLEAALEEALRDWPLLVVLDNVEHVVEAAGAISELAQRAPELRVLATSRVRLGIAGEHVHDVPPLALDGDDRPAAVAMFEQVATSLDPAFDLGAHRADVEAICAAVDGLPLAIELAAGHVRTLPPSLLRGRLHARLASPASSPRDRPDRQRTVPATVDWSLQLLGHAEQTLFARLGVFAGAVPLEALEQVCAAGDADVVEPLGRLVDASLVRRVTSPDGEARFGLLELLRERARALLDAHERDRLRDAYVAWVTGRLQDVDDRHWGDLAATWLARVSDLMPEVRAAHAWLQSSGDVARTAALTAALGSYWYREGSYDEGRRWTAGALAGTEGLPDGVVARLHRAAGYLEYARDVRVARDHWTTSARLFERAGEQRELASALALQALGSVGDASAYDSALATAGRALDLARRTGLDALVAHVLVLQGEVARGGGDDALAERAYDEALVLAQRAGEDALASTALANLSFLAVHRGDFTAARRLKLDALRICARHGYRMMAAWTVAELAGPELGLGHAELAARLLGAGEQALRALRVNRLPADEQEYQVVVAGVRAALGDDAFDRLHAEGSRLSLDDAVQLATAAPDDAESLRLPLPRPAEGRSAGVR